MTETNTEINAIVDPSGASHALADIVARERLNNIGTSLDNFNTAATDNKKRLDDLNTSVTDNKKRLDDLNTSVTDNKKRLDDLNTSVTDTNNTLTEVRSQVTDNQQAIAQLASASVGDIFEYLEEQYPDGGAGLHNSIFRGKNLGSAPTDEQYENIKNGTFKGIWLGDYYHAADGRNYRYGCLNWGSHIGDNVDQGNNALIIPDTCVLNADGDTTKYMQDADTVPSNGYLGTKMWTDTLPNRALPILQKVFGSHIISHREILCNATSDGIGTAWAWVDVTINIPNQIMVYGNQVWMQKQYGDGYQQGSRHHILPLFLARPDLVNIRQNYWLSDFTSSTYFASVRDYGRANAYYASDPWIGVRPYVIID